MRIKPILQFFQKFTQAKIKPAEMTRIYGEASAFVERIPKEKFSKAVSSIFKIDDKPHIALERLAELRKCAEELNCPKEIKDLINKIEKETRAFITRAETFSTSSKRCLYDENVFFNKQFEYDFQKIEKYFINKKEAFVNANKDMPWEDKLAIRKQYMDAWDIAGSCRYTTPIEDFKIVELPKGILPEDGMVYHGTTKARKIIKEGLSPFRSNQIDRAPREFGAGLYVTPNKGVASYFARIFGRIMPMKANVQKTAFVEEYTFGLLSRESTKLAQDAGIDVLENNKLNNAIRELIMTRLFKEAGYDSVYTANGMNSGLFTRSIDDFIGKAQSQLVVFDPKNITLGGKKKLSQKISDEILQIKTALSSNIYTIKTAFKDPLSILMT